METLKARLIDEISSGTEGGRHANHGWSAADTAVSEGGADAPAPSSAPRARTPVRQRPQSESRSTTPVRPARSKKKVQKTMPDEAVPPRQSPQNINESGKDAPLTTPPNAPEKVCAATSSVEYKWVGERCAGGRHAKST